MFRKNRQGIEVQSYTGLGSLQFKIPLDMLGLVMIFIEMYGNLIATYASGTPVARQGSIINSLVSSIRVVIGGDPIKSASPEMFRLIQMFVEGFSPLFNATGSATAADYALTSIAGGASAPFGTTGQYQNFNEKISVYMMLPYVESLSEQLSTVVRTKGLAEAYVELVQQAANNILDGANTAPVVYTGLSALKFRVDFEELKEDFAGELDNPDFYGALERYRTIEKTDTLTGQNDARYVDMNGGNGKLLGIIMKQRDGAAGSATTATSKLANDAIIQQVEFVGDDDKYLGKGLWRTLKGIQKMKFRYYDPLASSVSEDTGVSSMWWVKSRKSEAYNLVGTKTFKCIVKSAAQATASDYGTNGAVTKYVSEFITAK